jgi:hypothetical protein
MSLKKIPARKPKHSYTYTTTILTRVAYPFELRLLELLEKALLYKNAFSDPDCVEVLEKDQKMAKNDIKLKRFTFFVRSGHSPFFNTPKVRYPTDRSE